MKKFLIGGAGLVVLIGLGALFPAAILWITTPLRWFPVFFILVAAGPAVLATAIYARVQGLAFGEAWTELIWGRSGDPKANNRRAGVILITAFLVLLISWAMPGDNPVQSLERGLAGTAWAEVKSALTGTPVQPPLVAETEEQGFLASLLPPASQWQKAALILWAIGLPYAGFALREEIAAAIKWFGELLDKLTESGTAGGGTKGRQKNSRRRVTSEIVRGAAAGVSERIGRGR